MLSKRYLATPYTFLSKAVTGLGVGLLPPRMSCIYNSRIDSFPVAVAGPIAAVIFAACIREISIAKETEVNNPLNIFTTKDEILELVC